MLQHVDISYICYYYALEPSPLTPMPPRVRERAERECASRRVKESVASAVHCVQGKTAHIQ